MTANGCEPETAMEQFKAWCSRRLNERGTRDDWRGWRMKQDSRCAKSLWMNRHPHE
jgi:hypothetical protein